MEDLLKHAFDTTLVGLFALLCYAAVVLVCVRRARDAIRGLDPEKLGARAGLVVLPLAYVIGSITFAAADEAFNTPPPTGQILGQLGGLLDLSVQADSVIRREVYVKEHRSICHSRLPSFVRPPGLGPVSCVVTGGTIADSLVKRLYAFQKFTLLQDAGAAPELHAIRERLVILRGAALHAYVVFWIGLGGSVLALVVRLVATDRGAMRLLLAAGRWWSDTARAAGGPGVVPGRRRPRVVDMRVHRHRGEAQISTRAPTQARPANENGADVAVPLGRPHDA